MSRPLNPKQLDPVLGIDLVSCLALASSASAGFAFIQALSVLFGVISNRSTSIISISWISFQALAFENSSLTQ